VEGLQEILLLKMNEAFQQKRKGFVRGDVSRRVISSFLPAS
jgi:hypothetical protein